jgi:hypothetical protein
LSLYEQGIAALVEHQLPIESADGRVAYAAALGQFDQLEEARRQLTLACEAFEEMGATGACRRITSELEQLGSEAGRTGPAPRR